MNLSKSIRFHTSEDMYCCGLFTLGDFGSWSSNTTWFKPSGIGLYQATFIDNKHNREAYEQFCKDLTLEYQSKPRYNNNSGNMVFLCIFSDKR